MIAHQIAVCKDCYDAAADQWMNESHPVSGPWLSNIATLMRDYVLDKHIIISRGVIFWAPSIPTDMDVRQLWERGDLNFVKD